MDKAKCCTYAKPRTLQGSWFSEVWSGKDIQKTNSLQTLLVLVRKLLGKEVEKKMQVRLWLPVSDPHISGLKFTGPRLQVVTLLLYLSCLNDAPLAFRPNNIITSLFWGQTARFTSCKALQDGVVIPTGDHDLPTDDVIEESPKETCFAEWRARMIGHLMLMMLTQFLWCSQQ